MERILENNLYTIGRWMIVLEPLLLEHLVFVEDRHDTSSQWKKMWHVFDRYYFFLRSKGYKSLTISRKMNSAAIFLLNYLFSVSNVGAIHEADGRNMSEFMVDWYSNIFPGSHPSDKVKFGRAVLDFYTFLKDEGFVTKKRLGEIKKGLKTGIP